MPRRSFGRSDLGKAITRGTGGGGSRSKGITGIPRITQRRQNITTVRSPFGGKEYVDIWRYPDQNQTAGPFAGSGGLSGSTGGGSGPTADPAAGGWYEYDWTPPGGNAPDWWKAMAHTDLGEREAHLAQLNLMIPFMSPEDQRDAANTLYRELPEDFAHLAPGGLTFGSEPQDLGKRERQKYLGQGRGQGILDAIESLRTEVGKDVSEMGQGYTWLQQVSQLLKDYGATGERSITKGGYNQLLAGFKPLQEKAPEGFGLMGRMATMPFFGRDELMPKTTRMDQSQFFGKAAKGLFF